MFCKMKGCQNTYANPEGGVGGEARKAEFVIPVDDPPQM